MSAFSAHLKKEGRDLTRSFKGFLFLIIFAIIGLLSPLGAKFLPELIEQFLPEGMLLQIPEPVALDAWLQFHKNMTQLGYIFLLLAWSGTFVKESGPMIPLLIKGLKRTTVYHSKLVASVGLWTVSYWFSAAITAAYTYYYFPDTWQVEGLGWALLGLYLFGIGLLVSLFFGAILFSSSFAGLAWTAGGMIILFFGQLFFRLAEWSPLQLMTRFAEIYEVGAVDQEWGQGLLVFTVTTLLLIILTPLVYRRKEI